MFLLSAGELRMWGDSVEHGGVGNTQGYLRGWGPAGDLAPHPWAVPPSRDNYIHLSIATVQVLHGVGHQSHLRMLGAHQPFPSLLPPNAGSPPHTSDPQHKRIAIMANFQGHPAPW